MTKARKRRDIQYLRAFAVVLVVLYHAGVPGFKNGFLGVDIFFVISGYLMASLYSSKNFQAFYAARIKRLAPGLLFVACIALASGFFLYTPFEFNELSHEVRLGLVGLVNFHFWNDDTYFGSERFRPLLHFWTLAVELQFYAVFPLLARIARRIKWTWLLIAISSFGLSAILLTISPKTSFFLMPTRMWEFALGALAAQKILPWSFEKKLGRSFKALLVSVGIAVTLCFEIDPNSVSLIDGHPGLVALIVAAATALLLRLEMFKEDSKNLASRILVSVGDASYVTYLVHYFVLVFVNYSPFSPSVTIFQGVFESIGWAFGIIIIGTTLGELVEKRVLRSGLSTRSILIGVMVISVLSLILTPLQRNAATDLEKNISTSLTDRGVYRCGKLFRIQHPRSLTCNLYTSSSLTAKNVLLLGNSHADMIKSELVLEARKSKFNLRFWSDNNPFSGVESVEIIAREIIKTNTDFVVLHSSYLYPNKEYLQILVNFNYPTRVEFIMLESIPTYTDSVSRLEFYGKSESDIEKKKRINLSSLGVAKYYSDIQLDNFKYITTQDLFCSPICTWSRSKGVLFYFDSNHLTLTGAVVLRPKIQEVGRIVGELTTK